MSQTVSATNEHAEAPHVAVRTYLVIYVALLGLMALTVVAALFDLGPANFVVAMGIAAVKMVLIILYFMHVRYSDRLTWVFSFAAFLWLVILVSGFLIEVLNRGLVIEK